MNNLNILRNPDYILVQSDKTWKKLEQENGTRWIWKDIQLNISYNNFSLKTSVRSPKSPLKRIRLRWQCEIDSEVKILADHWERGYGDLEWRCMIPERIMPWYFMFYDGKYTYGYGVKTNARAMCFWQVDNKGISLWFDVRNGGTGVELENRELELANIVFRKGDKFETPFSVTSNFCSQLCDNPRLPPYPVYGGNNWYYAYGNSSHRQIIKDSRLIASLAPKSENLPFMVIDAGWQKNYGCNGGPWVSNDKFPDMKRLVREMKKLGVRPGIWMRPLLVSEKVPDAWLLERDIQDEEFEGAYYLDPSSPEVLDYISTEVKRLVSWGYQLIKHDFSTYDILGKWGFQMGGSPTAEGWSFADRSKTTAEVIMGLYKTIREAAGETILIGCNTIGHLAAGYFEIQRTGDDTSGKGWERTRKMGINTLAFRMPQHNSFFAHDADCVGITKDVPWDLNKKWLEILSLSGTPLFVSADPKALGPEQKQAIKKAFEIASKSQKSAEPLDWMNNVCPTRWKVKDEVRYYNFFDSKGIDFLEPGVDNVFEGRD